MAYIFVKEGGGGGVEEAAKVVAVPPLSPLMLIIYSCFEQGELSRGLCGMAADEPGWRAVELNEIGFFFPRLMAGWPAHDCGKSQASRWWPWPWKMNAINIYAWSSVAKASNDQKEFVTVTAATKTKNCNENEKKMCGNGNIFLTKFGWPSNLYRPQTLNRDSALF